ncbi:uncharacterized protein LOC142874245 [Microcebus murinus]|uniref:uncharacterized protein LOC142874245 n=1 Tax=Microcebus murinus TaxID=30608 RepID=UPI003F6C96D6
MAGTNGGGVGWCLRGGPAQCGLGAGPIWGGAISEWLEGAFLVAPACGLDQHTRHLSPQGVALGPVVWAAASEGPRGSVRAQSLSQGSWGPPSPPELKEDHLHCHLGVTSNTLCWPSRPPAHFLLGSGHGTQPRPHISPFHRPKRRRRTPAEDGCLEEAKGAEASAQRLRSRLGQRLCCSCHRSWLGFSISSFPRSTITHMAPHHLAGPERCWCPQQGQGALFVRRAPGRGPPGQRVRGQRRGRRVRAQRQNSASRPGDSSITAAAGAESRRPGGAAGAKPWKLRWLFLWDIHTVFGGSKKEGCKAMGSYLVEAYRDAEDSLST